MIFSKWRPGPALVACLIFAFADTLARLIGRALPALAVS